MVPGQAQIWQSLSWTHRSIGLSNTTLCYMPLKMVWAIKSFDVGVRIIYKLCFTVTVTVSGPLMLCYLSKITPNAVFLVYVAEHVVLWRRWFTVKVPINRFDLVINFINVNTIGILWQMHYSDKFNRSYHHMTTRSIANAKRKSVVWSQSSSTLVGFATILMTYYSFGPW